MLTPALRQDLKLYPGTAMEDGSPSWLLYDQLRNKYFTLGISAFRMVKNWIAGIDSKEFLKRIHEKGLDIQENQLNDFINFLQTNSLVIHSKTEDVKILLKQHTSQQKHWLLKLIHNYLFFKIPLIKPDPFLDKTLSLANSLSGPFVRYVIYVLGFLGIYFVIQNWSIFLTTFLYFFNWDGAILYAVTLVGVKAIHELGHAYCAKNYGCNVNSMGIAFLVFFPFLYTDNTNAWRLRSHKKRLKINFAGISTELHLALLATFFWGILEPGVLKSLAFFVATTSWISSLLINISPFMRFDGYYVFADYLKMENLQPRAFALAKWRLRNLLFGYKHSAPESMESSKQNLIIIYAWFTWIYRFFLFIGIAFLIYHFAFKLLGIILFVVEIFWFIALPVLKEINMWWKLRSELKFTYQLLRTIVILIVFSFIFFYPWKDFQKIPAVYQSEKFITLFPPINSQISQIYVEEKQFVNKNQNLIKLKSPQLNSEIIQSYEELNLINIKIENALEGVLTRADLLPLKSERDKLKIKINNLEKIDSSLLLKSPFEGEIVSLTDLSENQWVNDKTAVLSIVNKKQNHLIAFISEKDVLNIDINQSSYFIPSLIDQPKTEASIVAISESSMDNFDLYPMVTSLYGGPIAVRKTQVGNIRSEIAYYKVTLSIKEQPNLSDQKTMGVVDIGTRSESLMQKFIKFISATLLREISF